MDITATITQVSSTLKDLFAEKGELRGIQDWDRLIQCIIALDRVAAAASTPPQEGEVNG